MKCVMVIDPELSAGVRLNTAALLGASLGPHVLGWIGPDVADASGSVHQGLFNRAIAVLAAPGTQLADLRGTAILAGLTVVDFSIFSQQARTYDEYEAGLAEAKSENVTYLGIALFGDGRTVRSMTGSLKLLR